MDIEVIKSKYIYYNGEIRKYKYESFMKFIMNFFKIFGIQILYL